MPADESCPDLIHTSASGREEESERGTSKDSFLKGGTRECANTPYVSLTGLMC